jgi:hypothetical protein
MIRRFVRQVGALTIASFAWQHRGTIVRAVDLAKRAPQLVQTGRTEDLTTEARAIAALDGRFGDETDIRITGVEHGAVTLRDSIAGPSLDGARGALRSVPTVLDVRTEGVEHPTLDDALATAGS